MHDLQAFGFSMGTPPTLIYATSYFLFNNKHCSTAATFIPAVPTSIRLSTVITSQCPHRIIMKLVVSHLAAVLLMLGQTTTAFLPSYSPTTTSQRTLKATTNKESNSELFQRKLLETRLNLEQNSNNNNNNKESISSNNVDSSSTVKSTILEDADGLGAVAVAVKTTTIMEMSNGTTIDEEDVKQLLIDVEEEAEKIAQEMLDEECLIDQQTGGPVDALCADEEERVGFRNKLKQTVGKTLQLVRGMPKENVKEDDGNDVTKEQGDVLEQGWFDRGQKSSLRRNAEVWKFALKCVFRVLKPRSMKKKGASDDEVKKAQIEAATFIRDGLLTLGPTFVKLGQVVSTRTDVLPKTYTDVLNTLQDDVPAFSGARAKEIVSRELGRPADEIFTDFSAKPLKAASLGQVHTAYYKGEKVAIKVQRAGLKELFDVDLKNLKKLAVLLDKFDPKTDGADRDWVSIYEESERLLYLEIDYLNEADNCERFAKDFRSIDYVRVPRVYRELSTPRVLTMEFVESFKLTDLERIDALGLDRQLLARRTADSFLRQIVETSYFHCDRK
jgi:ABC1 atypical kinase-like domain